MMAAKLKRQESNRSYGRFSGVPALKRKNNHSQTLLNKELAAALDTARKDASDLRLENLELKRERHCLMERIVSLESRLSQLVSLHAVQQSLTETLWEIENKITHAKTLIGAVSTRNRLSFSSNFSPIPQLQKASQGNNQPFSTPVSKRCENIEQMMEVDQQNQPFICSVSNIQIPKPISFSSCSLSSVHIESNDQEILDEISELGLSRLSRPKRACASLISTYQEPSIQSKLRQGDPFTNSFNFCLDDRPAKKKLKTVKKAIGNKQLRKGLQDITNI